MFTLFLNGLPNNRLIQAVCWTLVHSLWQGLLIAIVAAFVVMRTRRSGAKLRYDLFTGLFLVFILFTCFTFLRQISISKKYEPRITPISLATVPGSTTHLMQGNSINETTNEPNLFGTIADYLDKQAPLIVIIWFIFFSARLVRILANIGYVQRIRHYKTYAPPQYWEQKISGLAENLGVRRSVELLESAIVKIPMVVGLLKPVILVPLGLLSNLPPDQVEAVLLHELAHIRRKDYLVNLLQNFAEVLFFFNPAVWWISSLMREERENCCDDIAIGNIKNKKQFINALVAFQEYALQPTNPSAIAFAGRKKYLLNRVKRIIHNENKKLNAMEKGFFIFSIVAISFVGFISMKQIQPRAKSHQDTAPAIKTSDTVPSTHAIDTIPDRVEFYSTSSTTNRDGNTETKTVTAKDKNGKNYKIIVKDMEPLELFVDDKKIPSAQMGSYEKLIVKIEEAAESREIKEVLKTKMENAEQAENMSKLDAERRELLERLNVINEQLGKEKTLQFNSDHEWENAATQNLLKELQFKQRNEDLLNEEKMAESFNKNQDQFKLNFNTDALFQKKLFEQDREAQEKKYLTLLADAAPQKTLVETLNGQNILLHEQVLQDQQQNALILINPILEELQEEKIISLPQDETSFELNNKVLIVNGKKQPAEIHERFKKKFLKKDGDYFKFSRKNGHTSTSINLN